MNILVTYYSRTGTTKKVGEVLACELGCDCEEIMDTVGRAGVKGYLRAGKDATLKKGTEIKLCKNRAVDYDLIIIGTPIWAWNMAPAVRTYLKENKDKFKKVAFFCTMGGSGSERAFKNMVKECGLAPSSVLALTTKEVVQNSFEKQIDSFINQMIG